MREEPSFLLAIDGGSQSTKISVVDTVGVVHAAARRSLRPYDLGPDGRAVHPADDLWTSLVETCRAALAAFADVGGESGSIAAVGLCGIRSCRALLDVDGRLVEPVLSWMDARIGRTVANLDPRVATLCSAGGYLAARLTGERRDSAASYDGWWPIDIASGAWSTDPAAYDASGMPRDLLPDLVPPAGLLGHLTEVAALETGLSAGLPVHATGNDKAVEALGCGLGTSRSPAGGEAEDQDGTVLLSLGTYVAAMTATPVGIVDPVASETGYWVNASAVPGTYLLESGGVRRGMWTPTWWRRLLAEAAEGAGGPVDEEALLAWLEQGASAVAPGSEGLVTLPDWLPPSHAPWRRGAMLGFGGEHGPHHVHRSILEGLALTMRTNIEALETALGRGPGPLVVCGGGSRSTLMMQVVADVLDRPVIRPGEPDAAGIGAAICAAVGAGLHPDVPSAVAAMVTRGARFEPDPEAARHYAALAAAYADLPALTDAAFRRLAAP